MLSGTPRTFVGSTTFSVRGLAEPHHARLLVNRVAAVDGVSAVTVDLATGTVTVRATRPLDRADVTAAVERAGFAAVP